MPNIDDTPAAVTGAGLDHNYTTPLGGAVTLVNAPVSPDRKTAGHTPAVYAAYVNAEIAAGRHHTATNVQLIDPRRPVQLTIPYGTATGYNYARLTIDGRNWYAHITDHEAVNDTVTRLHLSVDPFANYPGWSLGHSHIARSHAGVAASQTDTYGDLYCDAPEPIDAPPTLGVLSAEILDSSIADWTVIVVSANDLRGNGSATPYFERHVAESHVQNTVQYYMDAGEAFDLSLIDPDPFYPTYDDPTSGNWPYHGYDISDYGVPIPWALPGGGNVYVPNVTPSPVSTIDGVSQGGGVYLFTPVGFTNWMRVMQGASWVVEGITDIRMAPTWAVMGGGGSAPIGGNGGGARSPEAAVWAAAAAVPNFVETLTTNDYDQTVLDGWRETYLNSVGGQWFRKLVTGAYAKVLVGSGDTTTEYDPTLMHTPGVNTHARTGLAHGEGSIRVTVDYNTQGDQHTTVAAAGGSPGVVASGYSRAASNTASAAIAPASAALTNYQARSAAELNFILARHVEAEKVAMNMGIIGIQSVVQAGGGAALAGFAGAGPVGAFAGALVGGAGAAITGGVSSNNSLDLQDLSLGGSLDIVTYQLAAGGAMSALNFRTWYQSLDSVSGRGGNAGLSAAWRWTAGQGFRVTIAAPTADGVRRLLTTWRRYGYTIDRSFEPARLDVMSRYSYWQTEDATITGPIPNDAREQIAAAFDSGVTLYNNLADIGQDVSTSNAPVAGFTY